MCSPATERRRGPLLPAQTEASDQGPVPLDVVLPDVVEQSAPAAHEHEQSPAAVVVLLVGLEVLGEVVDALGEERDLYLGRAGVTLVQPVLGDRGGLVGHAN